MKEQLVELCHNNLYKISERIESRQLEKKLKKMRSGLTGKELLSTAIAISLVSSIVIFILIFNFNWAIATAVLILSAPLGIVLTKFYFNKKSERYEKRIEGQLADELPIMAIELKMNLEFENVLKKRIKKTHLGKEIKVIHSKIKNGSAVEKAIFECSEKFESEFIRQALNQLYLIYVHGNENLNGLKKIIENHKAEEIIKLKEKNQKQSYYSILFVASTTVLPTMAQAYLIIGSSFMGLDYGKDVWTLIAVIIFINIFMLVKMNET